jgi:hypothetical protein
MIDLSFLGKDGLMIQYEDVISVMGFNIIRYMINNDKCTPDMKRMSLEDILLKYLNRDSYDIDSWIKKEFGLDFHHLDARNSLHMVIPNFVYAYKVFQEAKKQNIPNLYVYSNEYYPGIEKLLPSFEVKELQYVHGDLLPILKDKPNITYMTSNPDNIRQCLNIMTPFVLTIVDDFIYISDIVKDKIDQRLRDQGKFVYYTGILNGGLTNVK